MNDDYDRRIAVRERTGVAVIGFLAVAFVACSAMAIRDCVRERSRPTSAYEARARSYAQRMFGDETPLVDCTHESSLGWRRCDVVTRGRILMLLCDGEGCSLRDRGTDTVVVPVVTTP